jgi:hypothetical protein
VADAPQRPGDFGGLNYDDRRHGPGWGDRLPGHDAVWDGDEEINRLDKAGPATTFFHASLISVMKRYHAQNSHTMAGNFGCFRLSFTLTESKQLLRSAQLAQIVQRVEIDDDSNEPAAKASYWGPNAEGSKIPPPRVGSYQNQIRTYLARGWAALRNYKDVLPYVTFVFSMTGVVTVANGSNWAKYIASVAALCLIWSLIRLRVQDDRALEAAARAWPRLRDYRPARYEWETSKHKSPGKWPLGAAALVIAVAVIWGVARDAHEPSLPWWPIARDIGVPLLAACTVAYLWLYHRGHALRRACRKEVKEVKKARRARRSGEKPSPLNHPRADNNLGIPLPER